MAESASARTRPLAMRIGIALVALVLLVALGLAVRHLMQGTAEGAKRPPRVSLIPTTPPPPPPPPKEEKRPEPPREQKEARVEQPEQKNEPPPDTTLKMEGAAGDGPSPFTQGAVRDESMKNLGQPGAPGGGPGGAVPRAGVLDPFNVYAGALRGELQRLLARRPELKRRRYGVEVNLWIGEDGRLARFELLGSAGDDDTDQAIRDALAAVANFSEAPPPRMPQPLRLRIVAGGRA